MRCLPPPVEPLGAEGGVVICGLCLVTRRYEAAGRAFFESHERVICDDVKTEGNDQSDDDPEEDVEYKEEANSKNWKSKRREKLQGGALSRLKKLVEGPCLYSVLDVSPSAGVDEIRKAYRQLALRHHPDKAKNNLLNSPTASTNSTSPSSVSDEPKENGALEQTGEESCDHAHFLLIQDSYEILSDPWTRRQYDSALPFDDNIPDPEDLVPTSAEMGIGKTFADASKSKFYEVFDPVFKSNARWSTRKPAPELGDDGTPLAKVKRFYEFWFNFSSWRDFSILCDEYDTDDAECREERRWMERQNQTARKEHERAEKARIFRLVELAQSKDPRIVAATEEKERKRKEIKDAKRREAQAKEDAKIHKEVEQKRLLEEAERSKREKEVEDSQRRQKERQELKKWRQRLRQMNAKHSEGIENPVSPEDLRSFYLSVDDAEKLQFICEDLEQSLVKDPHHPSNYSHSTLLEACQKLKRYISIHGDKLKEEEMQKELHGQALLLEKQQAKITAVKEKSVWNKDELALLVKGLQKYPGGTVQRWKVIAEMIRTKSAEEVIEKAKEVAATPVRTGAINHGVVSTASGKESPVITGAPHKKSSKGEGLKNRSPAAQPSTNPVAEKRGALRENSLGGETEVSEKTTPTDGENRGPLKSAGGWSMSRQTALENALIRHPASLPPKERWMAIAKDVPGKTSSECLARFKEIREAVLASRKK